MAGPMRHRDIVHLDMDAFYASVEVRDDPRLEGKPVIVGGEGRRAVVSAASYEARRYGVRSAMPVVTARRLCPRGIFLPVRMGRYREVSDRIFDLFHRFTPLVEPVSIDEAFLDVTGCGNLFGPPADIARKIKKSVRDETGLTVSAGVAACKLVAKIASDLNKPDGLTVVPPGTEAHFLDPLPAGKLWGVGKVTEKALRDMGVRTIGDIARLPAEVLSRRFGEMGVHLHRLARGIDDREVEAAQEAKSVGHEETFDEDLTDPEAIRRELLSLSDRVGARMRRHALRGRTVTLKVRYGDFTMVTRAVTREEATDDGREILRDILSLLPATEAGKRPVRLLGISVSRLEGWGERPERFAQIPLFGGKPGPQAGEPARPERDPTRSARLNEAVDRIRGKFGRKGILPGTLVDRDD